MHQLTFSDQSMSIMSQLSMQQKMHFIESLSNINMDNFVGDTAIYGRFTRDKTTYYRTRIDEFRIYFERRSQNILFVNYILPKHTWSDFLFRFKLPFNDEVAVEKNENFWKNLETLKK